MSKKKNGNNHKKPEEPQLTRRSVLKLGLWGALGLAVTGGAGGTAAVLLSGREPAAQQPSRTPRSAWEPLYNEKGVVVDQEYLLQSKYYKIREESTHLPLEEFNELDGRLNKITSFAYNHFIKEATPENYNEAVFYQICGLSLTLDKLIQNPENIARMFNLREHSLFSELIKNQSSKNQSQDSNDLAKDILAASILITQQKLEESNTNGDAWDHFFKNIKQGKGDCSDYTYAVANLYYVTCLHLERPDLASKIRPTIGYLINPDWSVFDNNAHVWMQFNDNGKWVNFDINRSDRIKHDDPININTPALYWVTEVNGGYIVPLITSKVFFNSGTQGKLERRSHVTPKKE